MSNSPPPPKPDESQGEARPYLARYAAVVIKNILGWALMLSAIVLGGVFPVPVGTPMFLIGFAMITLPGKRRLTSSALRGIPITIYTRKAFWWRLAVSLLLPPATVWILEFQRWQTLHPSKMSLGHLCLLYAIALASAWVLTWVVLKAINAVVKILPRVRRHVRPWLRGHGIHLLPPRRKVRRAGSSSRPVDQERIISINRGSNPLRGWGNGEKS